MMNGRGKSDGSIVPGKRANKGSDELPAEHVEGRGPAKGNPSQQHRLRTQGRERRALPSGCLEEKAKDSGHNLDALIPARRGGSQPRLKAEQVPAFIERFTAGPTEMDGGLCTLRGKDAQRILAQEFGVHYSLNGVYQLLHRHNLACLKPRPKHRKHDEQASQQWLNEAPFLSSACASSRMNMSRSKSGSRMKPASASKAR